MEKVPKISVAFCFFFLLHLPAWACLSCNRPLQISILNADFWKNSFYILLPLLVVGIIVAKIYKLK